MSNRDDYPELVKEILDAYDVTTTLKMRVHPAGAPTAKSFVERLEAELHNAFVAGQESVDCSVDELPEVTRDLEQEVAVIKERLVGLEQLTVDGEKQSLVYILSNLFRRTAELEKDLFNHSKRVNTRLTDHEDSIRELEETVRQEALLTKADRQTRNLQRPLEPIEVKVLERVQRLEAEIAKMDGRINRLTDDVTNADISIKNQSKKMGKQVDKCPCRKLLEPQDMNKATPKDAASLARIREVILTEGCPLCGKRDEND